MHLASMRHDASKCTLMFHGVIHVSGRKKVQKLEEQLTQVRALLSHTVDTLEQERRLSAVTKNRVAGVTT